MARGGARVVSGPPPDPNALRRDRKDDRGSWTMLPAEGRPGRPPLWPLADATPREADVWSELWEKPQAIMWEQLGQVLEVALFTRTLVEAEQPDSRVDVRKLARQYLDSLGLSVAGMLRNRWKIVALPESHQPEEDEDKAAFVPARRSARDRMKVVAIRGDRT